MPAKMILTVGDVGAPSLWLDRAMTDVPGGEGGSQIKAGRSKFVAPRA